MSNDEKKPEDDLDEEEECECNCGRCADGDTAQQGEDLFLATLFNGCVLMHTSGGDNIPLVLAACEGAIYLGGLLTFHDDGSVGLLNPLRYMEVIDQKTRTVVGGLVRPYSQLGLPQTMYCMSSSLTTLKADNKKDVSVAELYYDMYQRFTAEDLGITLPPSGTVIGRA